MNNYIFLYITRDYPYAYMANNTKFSLLAKELCSIGNKVCIVNDPYHSKKGSFTKKIDGYDIIQWSNNLNVTNNLRSLLKKRLVPNGKNIVIVEYFNFLKFNKVISICHEENYLIGAAFQEWHFNIEHTLKGKINALFVERLLFRKCDFLLPISEYLIKKSNLLNEHIFKLPILSPFSPNEKNILIEPYFAYCVSLEYKKTIYKVLDALSYVKHKDIRLKLIINGSPKAIDEFSNYVKNLVISKKVDVLFNVPSDKLKSIYQHSLGLLIPLIPNYIPDIARFSQKIAEYLETGRPILSTNVGEVSFYFTDRVNAYIMDYTSECIAKTMDEIIDYPMKSSEIGAAGWHLGNDLFNVSKVSSDLNCYIEKL